MAAARRDARFATWTRRSKPASRLGAALLAGAALVAASQAFAEEKLTVWWSRGFYKAEDDALDAVIAKFEARTGVKVQLSRHPVQEIIPKTTAALDAGTPPDIAFADVYDFQVTGKWAFDGKLEDISDIIAPIKDRFLPNTIEATHLYNDKTRRKAYYAFPLKQQTIQIQYWRDMLAEAGFTEADIPTAWKAYWNFWCDRVQSAHRAKTGRKTYAMGQPMGPDSSDSYYSFLTFADAYDVRMVDADGRLRVDDPKVRQGLIAALRDYTDIYTRGCTPAASTSWKDPDNDGAFNDKAILMTLNPRIAIAAKWQDDANNAALPAEKRAQAKANYDTRIATAGLPNRPDGTRMVYRAVIKTGVIFEAAKGKSRAKEFLATLLQDENLQPWVEAAGGRWFPVTKSGAASAYWQADPHRRAMLRQFGAGTVTFEFTRNHRFTTLNNENVWAKAMGRVVNDRVPVDKAVDELIARIKHVAG